MTRSVCPRPGCGELYRRTARQHACEMHAAEDRARDEARRAAHPRRAVYRDPRWPALSEACIERAGFTCVDCGRHELELDDNERLLADHRRGTLEAIAAGVALELDELDARCSTCSGRRDGQRAARQGGALDSAPSQSTPPLPLRAFRPAADETETAAFVL
jgi:5-methylcytosine-specific restriction endonuclease McrA